MTYKNALILILGTLCIINTYGLLIYEFSFPPYAWLYYLVILSFVVLIIFFYVKNGITLKFLTFLPSLIIFMLLTLALIVFSYLAACLNWPLVDQYLNNIDRALGFSHPAIVYWFKNHYWADIISNLAYNSLILQQLFILVYFILTNQLVNFDRYIGLYSIAAILSIIISGVWPASGPYELYNTINADQADILQFFYGLRDGSGRLLEPEIMRGIITLPSFHAILGLIFIYIFRSQHKYILLPIMVLNIMMVISTLTTGQHYFSDILMGVIVLLLAIWLERKLFIKSKLASHVSDPGVIRVQLE